MNSIENISLKLSNGLGKKLNKNEEEIAVLNYGLFIIIHTAISIITTIFIGVITGLFIEIITISFTGALFKRYSGGTHASTPRNCTIIGVLFALILSILCKYSVKNIQIYVLLPIICILLVFCCWILYRKCPVPSKNKTFKSEESRRKIRKRAFNLAKICLVIVIALLLVYLNTEIEVIKTIILSIVLGMSLQMLALTNIGTGIIQYIDAILIKV